MNDKLICIKDEDDPILIDLLSDGWKIIQISAAGIYCWVLLRKPLNHSHDNHNNNFSYTSSNPICFIIQQQIR